MNKYLFTKASILSLSILTLLVMTACTDELGNPEAYQDGSNNCSPEFAIDYQTASSTIQSDMSLGDYSDADRTIDDFSLKYQNVACDAHIIQAENDPISPFDYDGTVDVNSEVNKWRTWTDNQREIDQNSKIPIYVPPTPANLSSPTTIYPREKLLTFRITNPDKFNFYASATLQDPKGTILSSVDSVEKSNFNCRFYNFRSTKTQFKMGDKLIFKVTSTTSGLDALSTNSNLDLICTRNLDSSRSIEEIEIRDLQDIFRDLAVVSGEIDP